MKRFSGKVALVTGATTGIGQATAVRLASEGALVAVNRKPGLDADETLAKVKAAGGEAFDIEADMRDPVAVKAMVQEAAKRGGRLDYIVSNAAINPFMPWDATDIEDFNELFEINVRGQLGGLHGRGQADDRRKAWRRHRHDFIDLRPCRIADAGRLLWNKGCDHHAGQGAGFGSGQPWHPRQRS